MCVYFPVVPVRADWQSSGHSVFLDMHHDHNCPERQAPCDRVAANKCAQLATLFSRVKIPEPSLLFFAFFSDAFFFFSPSKSDLKKYCSGLETGSGLFLPGRIFLAMDKCLSGGRKSAETA